MAIQDIGIFSVKEINRLKILQDVIERNLRPGQAAEMIEAANAFAEEYMADYNRRFAKVPLHDFNAHQPADIRR